MITVIYRVGHGGIIKRVVAREARPDGVAQIIWYGPAQDLL